MFDNYFGVEGEIRCSIIYKSIFDKEIRTWLIKRITDKQWQKEKLIQLGLKTCTIFFNSSKSKPP